MNESLLEVLQSRKEKKELSVLMQCNEKTESFGLSLTEEDAHELVLCRNASLKKYRRVEFGEGILDKLIFTFCDSQYINQENYREVMEELQILRQLQITATFAQYSQDMMIQRGLLLMM